MDEMKHGADEIVLAPETIPSDEVAAEDSVPHDEMVNEDVAVMVEAEPKQAVRVNEILELRQSNRKVFCTLLMRTLPTTRRSPTVAVTSPPYKYDDSERTTKVKSTPTTQLVSKASTILSPKSKTFCRAIFARLFFFPAAIHKKIAAFLIKSPRAPHNLWKISKKHVSFWNFLTLLGTFLRFLFRLEVVPLSN